MTLYFLNKQQVFSNDHEFLIIRKQAFNFVSFSLFKNSLETFEKRTDVNLLLII